MGFIYEFMREVPWRIDEGASWLLQAIPFLGDPEVQSILRSTAAIVTILSAIFTYLLRRRESKRTKASSSPRLAYSLHSRDPVHGFPLSRGYAPFPYLRDDTESRIKDSAGWLTLTEIRVWNAGGGVVHGAQLDSRTKVSIELRPEFGAYEISSIISNDRALRAGVGRTIHRGRGPAIPIHFDALRPGKGLLISLRHAQANHLGQISIMATNGDSAEPIRGFTHAISKSARDFFRRISMSLVVPVGVFAGVMLLAEHYWIGICAIFYTWTLIAAVVADGAGDLAQPEDLVWGHPGTSLVERARCRICNTIHAYPEASRVH